MTNEVQATGKRHLPLAFWLILLVAVALRLSAVTLYGTHHPDEAFQYLEQAHRLVFDYGLVPWEFRYFIRSWLIPLMLSAPMALGEAVQPGGTAYLWFTRLFVVTVNLTPVVAAWFIGARSSRSHAILAMAVVAIWVESVLFSVQTLSESFAVACFLPAVALLRPAASTRAIVAAGALMALAGLCRYHFAPAIALFALLSAGRDWRMWRGLILGGLPILAAGAAIDLMAGLYPYQWIVNGYHEVVTKDRMTSVGGDIDPWYFLKAADHYWGVMAAIIVGLSFYAGRRHALLMIVAWANVLVHQLIGHKEWRYLWLSIEILLVLAAIGSVNVALRLLADVKPSLRDKAIVALPLLLWSLVSASFAASPVFRFEWRTNGEASELGALAGRTDRVCGLSVPNYLNTVFGYYVIHRPIPLYLHSVDQAAKRSRVDESMGAFNAIIVPADHRPPPGFDTKLGCGGYNVDRVCLYLRPGGCTPSPASERLRHQRLLLKANM